LGRGRVALDRRSVPITEIGYVIARTLEDGRYSDQLWEILEGDSHTVRCPLHVLAVERGVQVDVAGWPRGVDQVFTG
jgi:hypothetical protein